MHHHTPLDLATHLTCPCAPCLSHAGAQIFTCYQEVKLQERSSGVDPTSLPGALTVILQDELADVVQPGGEELRPLRGLMGLAGLAIRAGMAARLLVPS